MNEGFWVGFTVYYNGAFRSRFPTTLINVYGAERGPELWVCTAPCTFTSQRRLANQRQDNKSRLLCNTFHNMSEITKRVVALSLAAGAGALLTTAVFYLREKLKKEPEKPRMTLFHCFPFRPCRCTWLIAGALLSFQSLVLQCVQERSACSRICSRSGHLYMKYVLPLYLGLGYGGWTKEVQQK